MGLIAEEEGVAARVLRGCGVSLPAARAKVQETIGVIETASTGSPPFTPRAKRVLELSLRVAIELGHHSIGTEHMLLGVVREGEGVACQVLIALGVDLGELRPKVLEALRAERTPGHTSGVRQFPLGVVGGGETPGTYAALRVVTTGRDPEHYRAAYAELSGLVERLGLDCSLVLPAQLELGTARTPDGPGMVLSVALTLPATEGGGEEGSGRADQPR